MQTTNIVNEPLLIMKFDITKVSEPGKSFRVASVMGKFDLSSNKIEEHFVGEIIPPAKWNIGLIVGPSGTGKTTIAKELFPKIYHSDFKYKSPCILDDMPKDCSVEDISKAFNSVGFSSPPSWLKPYSALSNGEKMRVDLARHILADQKLFLFDEFTSVVDRQVAQIGSYAMQKAIRKQDRQFIAVTCHSDVEDWLMPDWIFNTLDMTFKVVESKKKDLDSNSKSQKSLNQKEKQSIGKYLVSTII
jgi:ABC-type ATPase with predicted acetyltransferase domain